MPCYYPLKGWRARTPERSGKYKIVFTPSAGYRDQPLEVPCGQCIGCRLERARQWAVRCMHEASLYVSNCFVTFTYDDEHMPKGMSLCKRDFQLFMKRLRKQFKGVRYFHCGEYGDRFGRPHYHAILFNFWPSDFKFHRRSDRGDISFTSTILSELWGKGLVEFGAVTFESASYVARYSMKKVTGPKAEEHYVYIDEQGEFFTRQPEYVTMSRRPGIGRPWLDKYMADVYPSDFVVSRGRKMMPTDYYDSQYALENPEGAEDVKLRRKRKGFANRKNNTFDRLQVREKVVRGKLSKLKRDLK